MHYSYLYGDNYFYGKDLVSMIEELQREREALRGLHLLNTSFPEDLKNMVLGIERDLHKNRPKDKPYKIKDTWYKNGKVMPAEDVGRV
jgi:hypothetical protein